MGLIEEVITEPMLQADPMAVSRSISDVVYTMDNGGAERKFFYDTFANNTIAQYTVSGSPSITNGLLTLLQNDSIMKTLDAGASVGKWAAVVQFNTTYIATDQDVLLYIGASSYIRARRTTGNLIKLTLYVNSTTLLAYTSTTVTLADATMGRMSVTYDGTVYQMRWNDVTVGAAITGPAPSTPSIGLKYISGATSTMSSGGLQFAPSIAYAEPFTDAMRYAATETMPAPIALYTFDETRNLLKYSQQMDAIATANWNQNAATVTANATTAPDGTTTADRVVEQAVTDTHGIDQTVSMPASSPFIFSCYAKQGERTWLRLAITDKAGVTTSTWFDLANGVLGTMNTLGATITAAANGFYRCSISHNTSSGASSFIVRIRLATANESASYTGDASCGLYAWGAQLEVPPQSGVNLLKYTQEFDNAAWTKTRCTVTPNTAIAPDGTMTADALVEDATAGATHFVSQTVTLTNTGNYVLTKSLKKGSRTWARLSILNRDSVSGYAYFDLQNGAIGNTSNLVSYSINSDREGYYRCSIVMSAGTGGNAGVGYAHLAVSNNVTFDGDPTTYPVGIYIWGAQLETGSSPSMYEVHPNMGTGPGIYFPTTDKQILYDTSKPRVNLLLPNQANCCGDGTTLGFTAAFGATISADADGLKVVTPNVAAGEGVSTTAYMTECLPNTPYTLFIRIKGSGSVTPALYEKTDDGTTVTPNIFAQITLSGSFVDYQYTITTGATVRKLLTLIGTPTKSAITFYVSKMMIAQGSSISAYVAPPNHGLLGGVLVNNTNCPTWTPKGLSFTTDDFVALPAMLAGKTAATAMVVANVTSSVANAGLIGPVSTSAANFSFLIRDYTAGTDNIRITTSDGTNLKAVDLPIKMSATYEMITGRFLGSTYQKIRRGLNADTSSSTAIPTSLNPDTTKLLYLGRSETGYLTGTICLVVIFDVVLTDVQVAAKLQEYSGMLLRKGVAL